MEAFLNNCFMYLFTDEASKQKVAELNLAKASLTKPWPTTDEANQSPVV